MATTVTHRRRAVAQRIALGVESCLGLQTWRSGTTKLGLASGVSIQTLVSLPESVVFRCAGRNPISWVLLEGLALLCWTQLQLPVLLKSLALEKGDAVCVAPQVEPPLAERF